MCTQGKKSKKSYSAEGAPNLGESGGMLSQQKSFKFGGSRKCHLLRVLQGIFSCLFYPSISSVIG